MAHPAKKEGAISFEWARYQVPPRIANKIPVFLG
jgi:hypothetical protein